MIASSGRSRQRRLLRLFGTLADEDQDTLLAFAEFLAARHEPKPPATLPEPQLTPRPKKESVVGAIKRLSASYPMLDRSRMLNETSSLMTQHVIHGRAAGEVIDELEQLFRRHYERFREEFGRE